MFEFTTTQLSRMFGGNVAPATHWHTGPRALVQLLPRGRTYVAFSVGQTVNSSQMLGDMLEGMAALSEIDWAVIAA